MVSEQKELKILALWLQIYRGCTETLKSSEGMMTVNQYYDQLVE